MLSIDKSIVFDKKAINDRTIIHDGTIVYDRHSMSTIDISYVSIVAIGQLNGSKHRLHRIICNVHTVQSKSKTRIGAIMKGFSTSTYYIRNALISLVRLRH